MSTSDTMFMRGLPFVLVLLVLSGCKDPADDLSPSAAYEAAQAAMIERDANHAMPLLKSAANRGHLEAARFLAESFERGTLMPSDSGGLNRSDGTIVLPIRVLPGQSGRWRRHFESLMEDSLAVGSHNAMMLRVSQLLHPMRENPGPNDQAEAMAMLRELAEEGHFGAALQLAIQLRQSDSEEAERWLDRSAELGHPQACFFKVSLFNSSEADTTSVVGLRRYIDSMAPCETEAAVTNGSLFFVTNTYRAARSGIASAQIRMDSLEAAEILEHFPPEHFEQL